VISLTTLVSPLGRELLANRRHDPHEPARIVASGPIRVCTGEQSGFRDQAGLKVERRLTSAMHEIENSALAD
jgi:hypothetical protein